MKTNGSVYVSVVLAALIAYFGYQFWFNPQRTIKHRLAELAASLSVPSGDEGQADRAAQAERVGSYLSADAHIRVGAPAPEFPSRDAFLDALRAWMPPPGGVNVDFLDVQVALDSSSTGHVYLTMEITGRNAVTGELARDTREMLVGIGLSDGAWVVTSAHAGL